MRRRRRFDLALRGLGLQRPAPVVHDPAADTLSLWLRSDDELTGNLTTLAWGSRASAGASGAAAFLHGGSDEVTQPGTSFDGLASVHWAGATPRLDGAELVRTTLLGGGDGVGASYTAAYVVQPLAAGQHAVDGGGRYTHLNAAILGDAGAYVRHVVSSDAGACKVGALHYEAGVGYGGTTPLVWPGGFGVWGILWVVYTLSGSTLKLRAKTVGNAAAEATEAIAVLVDTAASDTAGVMGSQSAGAYTLNMRLAEAMVWPGQALSPAQISTREQGYFKARYPSLGL